MTDNDVKLIEARLGVALPERYKDAALAGQLKDPIHDDSQSIIAINTAFRAGEFGDQQWRPSLIAFGHDGAGNYYCFDSDAFDSGIYMRDHETLEITKEYDTFDEFLPAWT
jgi:hypothetical protein